MELVAIGSSAFLPGFALAGVRTVLAHGTSDAMSQTRSAPAESIVILEDALVRDAQPADRAWLETSVQPIVITIGADDAQGEQRLRRAIKNTLGVDLLGDGR